MTSRPSLLPVPVPLYDPAREHDACGVGFVATTRGAGSAELVARAVEALAALAHRGGVAADAATGDGAGISLPLPPRFVAGIAGECGVTIPPGRLAVGMAFLPGDAALAEDAERSLEAELATCGLRAAGWRSVPVRQRVLAGRTADDVPRLRQVFVERPARMRRLAFARQLLLARRRFERAAPDGASIASLSAETIVFKGLFIGAEIGDFYEDLRRPDLEVRYAIFHQRYSTNTFPSWRLAQPFRYLAHNGEINTIRGNREQMRGRRHALGGGRWTAELAAAGPLISPDGSDSLSLDEALELLVLGGRRIDDALRLLIPAAPRLVDEGEPADVAPIEPWDGPAAVAFGDGAQVGMRLDRNGLRPAAFSETADGMVVVGSEAGCVALDAGRIVRRGRLGPGEMYTVDTVRGEIRTGTPRLVGRTTPQTLESRPIGLAQPATDDRTRLALGLDAEVLRQVIRPMATSAREPTWSMGDDTPIAPLATRPRRPTDHLRQAFAQVTNPAIDPEREAIVMSLDVHLGRRAALLDRDPRSASGLSLPGPILDAATLASVTRSFGPRRVARLDATWDVRAGSDGMAAALDRLARQAQRVRGRGHMLLLTDGRVGRHRAALPSILAVGRIHTALVDAGRRPLVDLLVEAGDLFDVHDVAMTLAAGADALHPRLLLELAAEVAGGRGAEDLAPQDALANVRDALEHGLRKVLARMGISTLHSYAGGQAFETVGLRPELVAACFPAAATHPGRIGPGEIATAILDRHAEAYAGPAVKLADPGLVRYRSSGELHAFAPPVVRALQAVARGAASDEIDGALLAYRTATSHHTPVLPRDQLATVPAGPVLPLAEVEAASAIVSRFVSSAMSLGALSPEAHQTLAIGMSRLGGSSNTGEGGEDPAWYDPLPNGDRRESAIKQVASARFGVTTHYLARAEQLEIKIAQGSKPGEGGQLPGRKATAFIAALRRGQPGTTMISPPPHHDIYSIEDLAQLIADLRAVNPWARIGVKLVASAGIGTIAAGVAKARADYVMVSGHSGGTGASPLSSIKHAGLPWELGLAEVHQVLLRNRLRDRLALRVDGGLQTGRDVVLAALLGAEEYGFGTSALVALGCDMARQCHLDTCPTGIATQRPELRAKFTGTPEAVVAFFMALAEDVRRELAGLGLRSLDEAIGRSDLLAADPDGLLDLSAVVAGPRWQVPRGRSGPPRHRRWPAAPAPVASAVEASLLPAILDDLRAGRPHAASAPITTRERSFGAAIAGELARDPVLSSTRPHLALRLSGSAGQSFGAFCVPDMRLVVDGEANDYVGKGLSGGTIVVRPPAESRFAAAEQAIAGNTCLYGATAGRLHLIGRAGMRFAVRNSGATAVVEGIGAHGCEYMTGGVVMVLGPAGPNFGAGMSGGRAYLYAPGGEEPGVNDSSVSARPLTAGADREMADELHALVAAHAAEGSARAAALLASWTAELPHFWLVVPHDAAADSPSATSAQEDVPMASGG